MSVLIDNISMFTCVWQTLSRAQRYLQHVFLMLETHSLTTPVIHTRLVIVSLKIQEDALGRLVINLKRETLSKQPLDDVLVHSFTLQCCF